MFDGLAFLRTLRFQGNELTALPKGLFIGLPRMRWVWAHDNPGAPFPLTVDLASRDVPVSEAKRIARIVAETATGAPFSMELELSVTGATADLATLQVPTGASSSNQMATITRAEEAPVWVNLEPPSFPHVLAEASLATRASPCPSGIRCACSTRGRWWPRESRTRRWRGR